MDQNHCFLNIRTKTYFNQILRVKTHFTLEFFAELILVFPQFILSPQPDPKVFNWIYNIKM